MLKSDVKVPIRTCISCGKKRHKGELIRLALDPMGKVIQDKEKIRPGRGAYVCPEKACLEGLTRGIRLQRAFRSAGAS